MTVQVTSELQTRLEQIARQRAMTMDELVRSVLSQFLEINNEPAVEWLLATQERLKHIWPNEDFTDWGPPNAA